MAEAGLSQLKHVPIIFELLPLLVIVHKLNLRVYKTGLFSHCTLSMGGSKINLSSSLIVVVVVPQYLSQVSVWPGRRITRKGILTPKGTTIIGQILGDLCQR